ncbi:MAG: BMP family ABC transporter substrate-binding protein [Clostridiales bacterium]|jgi:basic membrane protein A|nr:BMP family ABC transporter substrate-binding protein [Clostridiales bacterium]
MKKLLMVLCAVMLAAGTTAAFAGCGGGSKEFKVGVLYITGQNDTSGYTYAHHQGVLAMKSSLGLKDSQLVIKDNVKDDDPTAINRAIGDLIAEGCNMIIGTSFGYFDEIKEAALENPEIIFSHGTGELDTFGADEPGNMNNYFGRIYQARYLAGIVAGSEASVGANIGYVAAHGHYIAECSSGVNAFTLGVQAVNPGATVYVKTLGAWFELTNEKTFAENLIGYPYNCEIITQHCDTNGPSKAAQEKGKKSIGYNSDMALALGGTERDASVLTSVTWNWGVYYTEAVSKAMECFDGAKYVSAGPWKAWGNYYAGYKEGLFGLAPLSTSVSAATAAKLELVKAEMLKGTADWDVFSDKILKFNAVNGFADQFTLEIADRAEALKTSDGTAVTLTGGRVTDYEIKFNMPFWIKGVVDVTGAAA